MKRIDFIKGLGAIGLSFPLANLAVNNRKYIDTMDEPSNQELLSCTSTPSETAGPYPAPTSISTSSLVRTDITEGTQTGIPLDLTIQLYDLNNGCQAIGEGYRVDIWHCNIRGYYSAYADQPGIDGTVNTTGQTWLRGIQYTDAAGKVYFTTIYPGWYMPRATHIHVQVYDLASNLVLTTQLAFPDSINTTVNNYYSTSGTNSFTNSADMVFSDSLANELMTVTGNTTDGYVAFGEITVSGTLGIKNPDSENGGQFNALLSPNPMNDNAIIAINLIQESKVGIEILDETGRTVQSIPQKTMGSGQNSIGLSLTDLKAGLYFYKINCSNINGDFSQSKQFIKK